jgi:hypothetical protein
MSEDRHAANYGLQHGPQGSISLDMPVAPCARAPEKAVKKKRQVNSTEALGSTRMGSRHCRSLN